ncbi:hypothetical protein J6590_076011 [Homalodisca vitripennis]|nr:hypothetical protein J6590_076011 [Homalodisca vitripennis]
MFKFCAASESGRRAGCQFESANKINIQPDTIDTNPKAFAQFTLQPLGCFSRSFTSNKSVSKMSTKENNAEVAVDKVTENNEKSADAKAEVKGTKRPAEGMPAGSPDQSRNFEN